MPAPDEPLEIRPGLVVPAWCLDERFTPSGGPGGQHANRSSTRVELRLDLTVCPTFSDAQRERLVGRFGPELRVVADDERSQHRNRALARQRLASRLRNAMVAPRPRTATRPTRGSQTRRLEGKRRRAETKQSRRRPLPTEE